MFATSPPQVSAPNKINKWSKNFDKRPHRMSCRYSGTSSSISDSPIPSSIISSSFDSPRCFIHNPLSLWLPTCFTNSSRRSSIFPRTAFMDYHTNRFFWATCFFLFFSSYFSFLVPCAILSWPSLQLLSARKHSVSYRVVSYWGFNYPFCYVRIYRCRDAVQPPKLPILVRRSRPNLIFPWAYVSQPAKPHLDRFSRLCRAH